MKIVRYFIHNEWEDTGTCGFQPLWVPRSSNFTPSDSPRLLAHDMFEHRLCDTGKIHEEVMAFGRIVALRVNPGVIQRGFESVESSLGAEIGSIWCDTVNDLVNAGCLKAPPETSEVTTYSVECQLRKMAEKALFSVNRDLGDREFGEQVSLGQEQDVLGWLRIGYMDALRRYGQQDHGCYETGHAVDRWTKSREAREVEQYAEQEENDGNVLRLSWDTVQLRMSHRFYEPSGDYGRFPRWLRQRIWSWRNDRA